MFLIGELKRIKQCKGRVFSLQNEPMMARVWMPQDDYPGLAMSRAFGDFCLKKYGLISVPEVHFRCLSQRDEFIVLATDGVAIFFFFFYNHHPIHLFSL